jgi:hypothetical protein
MIISILGVPVPHPTGVWGPNVHDRYCRMCTLIMGEGLPKICEIQKHNVMLYTPNVVFC